MVTGSSKGKPANQDQSIAALLQGRVRSRASFRLFLMLALLLGLLVICADNQVNRGFTDDDLSAEVEGQIAQNQGNAIRQVCYIVLFGTGVVCLTRVREAKLEWRKPLAPMCAVLLAWSLLSTLWSDDPSLTVKRLLAYGFMVTGAVGISVLWSRQQIAQFISVVGAVGVTLGFLNELAFRAFRPWEGAYRFAGTQHENVQGFCCLLLVLASLAAADMTPRHKLFFRGLAAYGAVFLTLTKSRSSFLGISLGLVIYVLLTRPSKNKFWLAAGLSLGGLILYMTDILAPIMGYVSRNGEGLDTLTGRQPLWDLANDFVQRQPLTGYGYQAFWSAIHIEYFSGSFGWQISSAHSGYMEMILSLGYIGMLLHTAVLLLGVVMGGVYYKRTGIALYALASAIFAALLAVGYLESVVLISPGPYAFGLTLLMAALCLQSVFPGEEREKVQGSSAPSRGGFTHVLAKV